MSLKTKENNIYKINESVIQNKAKENVSQNKARKNVIQNKAKENVSQNKANKNNFNKSPISFVKFSLFIMLMILACTGCKENTETETTTFSGTAMTISYKIVIGDTINSYDQSEIKKIISDTFNEIDSIYNRWNPKSEISKINHAKAYEKITLSPELSFFLHKTNQIVELTEGRFDPTIEPAYQLWKNSLLKQSVPSSAELENIRKVVGWNHIHLDGNILWKDFADTSLDLGGIAKGYAIDLIIERLMSAGYQNTYVEWGGEIRTHGIHPEKRPWRIGISDFGGRCILETVDLNNDAVASSGDYLQYWTIGNDIYCHIIDPFTVTPLKVSGRSIGSSTVIASSCMLADALATATMLFSNPKEAEEWFYSKFPENENKIWVLTR